MVVRGGWGSTFFGTLNKEYRSWSVLIEGDGSLCSLELDGISQRTTRQGHDLSFDDDRDDDDDDEEEDDEGD